jgi:uncharacterized protein YjbI with pentapeptide repeats
MSEDKLQQADLSGANLRGADLRLANLRGANLTDADLTESVQEHTQFGDAEVEGANFADARQDHIQPPEG